MKVEFPNTDAVLIKAMVTLPAICALFLSQLSGWLASFVSKRRLVLAGILLCLIGGLGEYFSGDVYRMIASRLVLGVGLGLFMPMTTGLVADFYSGNERTKMLGVFSGGQLFGRRSCHSFGGLYCRRQLAECFFDLSILRYSVCGDRRRVAGAGKKSGDYCQISRIAPQDLFFGYWRIIAKGDRRFFGFGRLVLYHRRKYPG
jgi:hypothetical protein